jgi:hypothetical protein
LNVKDFLNYEPDSGHFYWCKSPTPRIKIGDKAGSLHGEGYITITVSKKAYLAHRLAWFFTHGVWPTEDIDHINGVRSDNRIINLRPASRKENIRNGRSRILTSKYKGVSWDKSRDKWVAYIKFDDKSKNLGRFDNEEDAAMTYNKWASEKFGDFARLNEIHPAICEQAIMV